MKKVFSERLQKREPSTEITSFSTLKKYFASYHNSTK